MTSRPLRALLPALIAAVLASCAARQPDRPAPPASYVVLVSFDGFRHDYVDRGISPVMDSLARAGVRADGLIPVMPTKTFPNHYSIATGMYASEHRLVANVFRDAELGTYSPADRSTVEDGAWYGGEPIWVAAQRQGVRTASMFWVGSEADVQGVRPDTWKRFDAAVPPEARVDSVLAWLRRPAGSRPRLLTLYFDFTDNAGTWSGPRSAEMDSAIAYADRLVGRLVRGVDALPHGDSVAYLLMSDHGMADVRGGVFLDEHAISLEGVHAQYHGPFATLYTGGDSARMNALRADLERVPHVSVYDRSTLPPAWHWSDPRLGDLILVADDGWLIGPSRQELPAGAHGWPSDMRAMHALFVASGAGVSDGVRLPAFENVHIHAFVAKLLGIERGSGSRDAGPLARALRGF